jgi:hypothetical protein
MRPKLDLSAACVIFSLCFYYVFTFYFFGVFAYYYFLIASRCFLGFDIVYLLSLSFILLLKDNL